MPFIFILPVQNHVDKVWKVCFHLYGTVNVLWFKIPIQFPWKVSCFENSWNFADQAVLLLALPFCENAKMLSLISLFTYVQLKTRLQTVRAFNSDITKICTGLITVLKIQPIKYVTNSHLCGVSVILSLCMTGLECTCHCAVSTRKAGHRWCPQTVPTSTKRPRTAHCSDPKTSSPCCGRTCGSSLQAPLLSQPTPALSHLSSFAVRWRGWKPTLTAALKRFSSIHSSAPTTSPSCLSALSKWVLFTPAFILWPRNFQMQYWLSTGVPSFRTKDRMH